MIQSQLEHIHLKNKECHKMKKNDINKIIEKGFLIRLVEEKLLALFQEGKIDGTIHTCIGQELIPVCVSEYLTDSDFVLSNHRGHGHLLSRNEDLVGFFAELMGRERGICGGLGGSQHLYTHNHISNGIQGGMTPIGAGIALANKIKKNDDLVVCYLGDGTLGEGIIYEAFNIASLWNLPIVYILENNRIAQSTTIEQSLAGSISQRAKGFGLEYMHTNMWDIQDMLKTFDNATHTAREKQKAVFVEVDAYRLHSHSRGVDNRNPLEIEAYKLKDILNKELEAIQHDGSNNFLTKIEERINKAVKEAEKSPKNNKAKKTLRKTSEIEYSKFQEEAVDGGKRINELIYESLKEQFTNNSDAILLGEDIEYITPWTTAPYGGAFKVSKDLSKYFENVKNTPISEASITGIGTGLSIAKMQPIVEIMFGDFMMLTFDQLYNHACKFNKMFNDQLSIPLVIRTPMGGKRGYGPTHSQSLEKHFLGITDLTIVALNNRISPKRIYRSVFLEKNPVLVIENKVLYTQTLELNAPIGYKVESTNEAYPTLKIAPERKEADITILCYGEMLTDVERSVELAFEEEEILCEIICPSKINPINVDALVESVRRTQRLLTVEEGSNIASYSSEVSALLMERSVQLKSFGRIANNEVIASSRLSEKNMIPNTNSIFEKIKDICNE